jgi:tRNA A-37 threonylcarbamoyl transferase component Bud32
VLHEIGRRPDIVVERTKRGLTLVKQRHALALGAAGLRSIQDFMDLRAEMISGHPGRNVARVSFESDRGLKHAFLKREFDIRWTQRWKSWRAGFGWSSLSVREALALDMVREQGIAAPDWIAVGQDDRGRAYVLLEAAEGAELRKFLLRGQSRSIEDRLCFAQSLGRSIARMHDAGVEHPDLYAKHILVERDGKSCTILDWQRSRRPHTLSASVRCRDLAALHASVADELADPVERDEFLAGYLDESKCALPNQKRLSAEIGRLAVERMRRSSVREQRLPTWHSSQPLVWLDGEAIAATPRCMQSWTHLELQRLAYGFQARGNALQSMMVLSPEGRRVRLTQRRTLRPFGSIWSSLLRRRWTSPELRAAAHLLRQERLGAMPRLLAFGQRAQSGGVINSFLLEETEAT